MKQLIIRVLTRFIPEIRPLVRIYRNQLRNKDSYLYVTGWTRSIMENRPCRPDGSPVPWMNYAVIALIQGRLNRSMRLFEYGSGYSTLFFSKLVGNVVSVEYDQAWHEKISIDLPQNARVMIFKNDVDGSYCRAIHQVDEFFDVVVVDGRDRVNCLKQALAKLNEGGVILLDDSQRENYQEGIDHVVRQGFKRLDIEGLKPGDHGANRTTIFYRGANCFSL